MPSLDCRMVCELRTKIERQDQTPSATILLHGGFAPSTRCGPRISLHAVLQMFSDRKVECYDKYVRLKIVARARSTTLLSSSMAEHPAVNRRVVGSSPT